MAAPQQRIYRGAGASTDTRHFEQDNIAVLVQVTPDYWYWDWLTNDSSKDFDFHIDAVAAGADAKLKLKLQGFSETDHDINILVNGAAVGSTNWSGPVESILTLEFDPALLLEGDNVLTLTHGGGTGEASYVYLNQFDVSDPLSYTAVDDSLAFAISDDSILVAGSTETTVQTITGFSSAEIKLLDISRPLQPRWIEGMTIDSAAAYRASFVPADGTGSYLAVSGAAIKTPAWATKGFGLQFAYP